jgi:hypothetical protein
VDEAKILDIAGGENIIFEVSPHLFFVFGSIRRPLHYGLLPVGSVGQQ